METPVIKVGTLNIDARAKQYIGEVLESNRLSYGPFARKFESKFARLHDCKFGVMLNSGTGALQIALATLKEIHNWRDGDEVIVPAVTFVATANIVIHNKMTPIFVDVEKDYYGIDPALIESRITDRTRAIIPVHLFGLPCEMDPILEIARKYGLKVIEDSCETMFASYRGKRVGSMGDIGCFSTYVAHLIVTGVGGLSITDNPDYAIKLRSLMNHGRDAIYISIDDDENKTHDELRTIIARRFSFVGLGHSFRVTEMEAALGLAQLENWEEIIARRRQNAGYLTEGLADLDRFIQLPRVRPGCEHSFMMFPVALRRRTKEKFVNYLEQNGVETRDMFPLISQPVYQSLFKLEVKNFPVADWINRNGFYVGCHQDLSAIDLDYMIELFHDYFTALPEKAKKLKRATLVIKTLNSVKLSQTVSESFPWELFDQYLVIDGGSVDGTVEFWEGKGAPVVRQTKAERAHAFSVGARLAEGEYVVFCELDGSENFEDIPRFIFLLERGYDLVIASRLMPGGRKIDSNRLIPYRGFGNRFFSLLIDVLFGGNVTDATNKFRAIRKESLEKLDPDAARLCYHYQMTIRAIKSGLKITELPTVEKGKPREDETWRIFASTFQFLGVIFKELLIGKKYPKKPGKRE